RDSTGRYSDGSAEDDAELVTGRIGRGLGLDGDEDFGRLGNNVNMARNTGELTLSAWVRLDTLSSPGAALISLSIGGGVSASSRATLLVHSDGRAVAAGRTVDADTPSGSAGSPT